PHAALRLWSDLLGLPESELRVITPDVGGGFGPKLGFYPEDAAVALAALILDRPVKWIEDRREHFVATTQERDQYWEAELAFDGQGRILGLRGTLLHDHGAYTARGVNLPYESAQTVTLPYDVPAYRLEVKLALTNKVPVTPVRGAGQPQGVFTMERLLDKAARTLGLDRAEIRRRNLITPERMPCEKPLVARGGLAVTLDSGDYPACQALALKHAGWDAFPARQAKARATGRRIGIGVANFVKGTGRGPFESARVRIGPSGRIEVATGAAAMGQGTRTMLAGIVGAALGTDPAVIAVTAGDTRAVPLGLGGFNSRQAVLAGSSAQVAAIAVREKALAIASHLLEASPADLEVADGAVRVKGAPQLQVGLGAVARAVAGLAGFPLPPGIAPGLEASEAVVIDRMAYANGTAVAEVEVDAATGLVTLTRFVLAHDCGR
ncbi:MAG: molybdopterin cofactor-binding domain-containing protein, partial [Stellaceae bacterium]